MWTKNGAVDVVIRWLAILVYAAAAWLLYRYGEALLEAFRQSDNLLLAVVIATAASFFPVIPYPVVGGVLGAAFGPVTGGVVAWTGSTLASLLMFLFIRYYYQELGRRMLRQSKHLDRLTGLFERNAFLAVLFARMIPIMPSIVINGYAALSQVRFSVYAAASALGKIPSMLLFAVVGSEAVTAPGRIVAVILLYGGFLGLTLLVYRRWNRSV
ncbi:putative membrane protein YdjX (TVP38/TMEM64 family) [Paenibacillus phyllosphaerae]|uniref:TVP38/TMEM64 family membrane protein n=1 Tax=Paenibacillus phyllosphaerae TaxID=274593 RepID=A0A7W5AXZ0_9BACL|nr:TVP38/TMEM64 family protein [Paenibacillus phyllosphaerae]MBB3110825.1 putative membrane protein YdjX (TVP38/TMEM64 family) [Paenibacillus phyllosphaerae]